MSLAISGGQIGAAALWMAIGAFALVAAMRDWDWFMNHRRAWLFVKLFGRQGARIAYGVLGAAFVIGAVVLLFVER